MRALQIQQFGSPAQALKLVEVADTPPGPSEIRVRAEAAGINPSEVAKANGKFPVTNLPRIVGRDFAGTVVEGPADLIGLPIWGSGGDIGFTCDGSHAEFINIPAGAAAVALRICRPKWSSELRGRVSRVKGAVRNDE